MSKKCIGGYGTDIDRQWRKMLNFHHTAASGESSYRHQGKELQSYRLPEIDYEEKA